jgi:hypothetical protein
MPQAQAEAKKPWSFGEAVAKAVPRLNTQLGDVIRERQKLEESYRQRPQDMQPEQVRKRLLAYRDRERKIRTQIASASAGNWSADLADPDDMMGENGRIALEAARLGRLTRL